MSVLKARGLETLERKMRGTDFSDYFRKSMEDPKARRLYRQVLDEELSWLLEHLRKVRGAGAEGLEVPKGFSARLEDLARYAQALGLSLRLEFADERGEVLARFSLAADEPLA